MNRKSLNMIYILPKRFIRFLMWSGFFGILMNHFILKKSWHQSFLDLYILFLIVSVVVGYRLIRLSIVKLIELARGGDSKKYTYGKYDRKIFDKRIGQFRLSMKWSWHIIKLPFKYESSEIKWTGRQEMVIRYPLNPNLHQGDLYHIQAISSHEVEQDGQRWHTLQGYCYELKRIVDFDVDKIQQAHDYPSGNPVSTNELMA